MPTCSCYVEKGLVYIAIIILSSCQPSFYVKYTKLNIRSSYNIYLILDAECTFPMRFYIF